MGECNGCGGCCNPVALNVTKASRKGLTDPDSMWIRRDLRVLSPQEAHARNPASTGHRAGRKRYWECRQFDPETKQCRRYDDRPPCCSGFPWYSADVMDPETLPSDECGYRVDVPAGLKVALRMAAPQEG